MYFDYNKTNKIIYLCVIKYINKICKVKYNQQTIVYIVNTEYYIYRS